MSCISGVGGGVPMLVKRARSGRPILALDGCVLACTRACLARVGVEPTRHMVLNQYGATKRYHQDSTEAERATAWEIVSTVARQFAADAAADAPSEFSVGCLATARQLEPIQVRAAGVLPDFDGCVPAGLAPRGR